MKLVIRNKWASITFAIIFLIVLIVISLNDFIIKKNWEAELDESSFKAVFTYFDGEYYIVVRGIRSKGRFIVNWDIIKK